MCTLFVYLVISSCAVSHDSCRLEMHVWMFLWKCVTLYNAIPAALTAESSSLMMRCYSLFLGLCVSTTQPATAPASCHRSWRRPTRPPPARYLVPAMPVCPVGLGRSLMCKYLRLQDCHGFWKPQRFRLKERRTSSGVVMCTQWVNRWVSDFLFILFFTMIH